eukprot:c21954_g1_i2 orf=288-1316(-)
MDSPRSPDSEDSPLSPSSSRAIPVDAPSEHLHKAVTNIRFLISNAAAGSVIGKGGTTINEFQSQSGARIQLSRNHEYFPGTTERVIALSGTVGEVLRAFHLILSKLLSEAESDGTNDAKTNQVRLIVPNNVCGAIIGKGGATIKAFVEDSHANIKLSSQEQTVAGVTDRIVTIIGTLEQQLRAVALIITKLSEDPHYVQSANAPISYAGTRLLSMQNLPGRFAAATISPPGYGIAPYGHGSVANSFRMNKVPLAGMPAGQLTSVTIAIPDEQVGAIVGRGGKTITDIQQASGVRIKISDRGDFVAGTKNRKVTITGTADGVHVAQQLLTQKVQQSFDSDFER